MDDDILEKKSKFVTNMSMCDIPCRLTGPNQAVSHCMSNLTDYQFI